MIQQIVATNREHVNFILTGFGKGLLSQGQAETMIVALIEKLTIPEGKATTSTSLTSTSTTPKRRRLAPPLYNFKWSPEAKEGLRKFNLTHGIHPGRKFTPEQRSAQRAFFKDMIATGKIVRIKVVVKVNNIS